MPQNFDIDFLASLYIDSGNNSHVTKSQLEHRINIVHNVWEIPAGSRILEIGPGQGDCTLVLAAAVGEAGRVDAVDPCDLDYGAPWTVGQSQAHLKQGVMGSHINFIQADPIDHLRTCTERYDYVVLFNCFWYFDTPSRIETLLSALQPKTQTKHILIAEWALQAASLKQIPHVLAALIREQSELHNPKSLQNIRTAVSPDWFRRWLTQHGMAIEKEVVVRTPEALQDARWEVSTVLEEGFVDQINQTVKNEQQAVAILIMRDALVSAVANLENGVKDVQCMQVWTAMI